MPSIKDESTVEAIARAFTAGKRVKGEALRKVGYSRHYSEHAGLKLFGNVRVKAAIARIDGKAVAKMDHDRDIAVTLLNENLIALTERVGNGDVGAISARTAVIRELNAISNLHSSTVHTSPDKPADLSPADAQQYRDQAAAANSARISMNTA